MDLNSLFIPQKELDEHILNEKGLHGQDLLKKKTVALICELYELANEMRVFKFWSNNQKPNNIVFTSCSDEKAEYFLCGECGIEMAPEDADERDHECSECDNTLMGMKKRNPMLEEYADVIHFTISIANDLGYTEHNYKDINAVDLNDLTLGITNIASMIPVNEILIQDLFNHIIKLGYQLGFDEEQVIDAYYDKNKENHARQKNGY